MKHVPGEPPNARRGEWLIQTTGTHDQNKLVDRGDVVAYLQEQRRLVEHRGQCGDGCTDLIKHYATGRLVCRRTLEPCLKQQLSALVELYSLV